MMTTTTTMMISETLWRCKAYTLNFSSTLITVIITLGGPSMRVNNIFFSLGSTSTAGMFQLDFVVVSIFFVMLYFALQCKENNR